jgi:hypothetical protein
VGGTRCRPARCRGGRRSCPVCRCAGSHADRDCGPAAAGVRFRTVDPGHGAHVDPPRVRGGTVGGQHRAGCYAPWACRRSGRCGGPGRPTPTPSSAGRASSSRRSAPRPRPRAPRSTSVTRPGSVQSRSWLPRRHHLGASRADPCRGGPPRRCCRSVKFPRVARSSSPGASGVSVAVGGLPW